MSFLEDTIKRVRDYDAGRPRSMQKAVGWSEVGGCRAYLGFRESGEWASDEPDSWGAARGTAIHKLLEEILSGEPGFRTEVTTAYRGIPGHADLIVIDDSSVTDHKTTRLANSRLWRSGSEAMWQKRVQINGYAAGLIEAGELPEDATVRLLVIPVDGTFDDWWCHEEPFSRELADAGADRLEAVRDAMSRGERLPKDKPYAWCRDWCEFFSICREPSDENAAETITDPELVAAIARYGETAGQITQLYKVKDGLAEQIRGLRGVAGEWRISLSKEGEKKPVLDEDWIRADYAARGEEIPVVLKPGAAPRLNVTRIKKAAK